MTPKAILRWLCEASTRFQPRGSDARQSVGPVGLVECLEWPAVKDSRILKCI